MKCHGVPTEPHDLRPNKPPLYISNRGSDRRAAFGADAARVSGKIVIALRALPAAEAASRPQS